MIKKIRGHRRRWKQIDKWINETKKLDVDFLKKHKCEYAEVLIHPWSGISITNSAIPQLRGKTKKKILAGLIEIHNSWEEQLSKLDESYYLKIWLYEPRFFKSQVVCAIDYKMEYYDNIFHKTTLKLSNLENKYKGLSSFSFETFFDEDYFDESYKRIPDQFFSKEECDSYNSWISKIIKKSHRKIEIKDSIPLYALKRGEILVLEKNT